MTHVLAALAAAPLGLTAPASAQTTPGLVGTDVLQFEGQVPTNLLFISIDTLRRDHFGPYSTLGLTPFFDELSEQSVVLKDHRQCSDWTYDSITCTLAGRLHTERGHMPRIYGPSPVPQGTPFLASWLGDHGFYNIVVSSNGWFSQNWGNTQGYDETSPGSGNAAQLMEYAMGLLQGAQARGDVTDRWFLHTHLFDPHPPYDPEPGYIEGIDGLNPWPTDLTDRTMQYAEWANYPNLPPKRQHLLLTHLRRLYEADVRMTDDRVRGAWETYRDAGLLDDTLVVVWNDHGEQFWEHGNQAHAWDLNAEENDGILMFWADNIVPGTWTQPTHSIDLVATLLDLYGIPRPPEITGTPIGSASPDRPMFTSSVARDGVMQAVIQGGYKLQYRWSDARINLYHYAVDPTEAVDLYDPLANHPQVLKMWLLLLPQIAAMDALVTDAPVYPPELPHP